MNSTSSSSARPGSTLATSLLAPNPGPMSLEGTNSYLISTAGSRASVVVDPGPAEESHLQALAGRGPVELILLTHGHADHAAGSVPLHQLTGAPVRAADPRHCHGGGHPLADGEKVLAGGVAIQVVATPGHTWDSVCFHLPDDGPDGSVLTGDTILGRGTTVLDYPDGMLGDYLTSLDRLEALGGATVLPAHGPMLASLAAVARAYRQHRLERLDQIRAALELLGLDAQVAAVADAVYADVEPQLRRAVEMSVAAQLHYLRSRPGS